MSDSVRLNKYLSDQGVLSRRKADEEIEKGKVTINGKVATLGDRVLPEDLVCYLGKPVKEKDENVLLMFNKPVGIVCTAEKREKDNIIDYINYPVRIYPIGRLDKDSSGLILMTNQGELVNKIMRGSNFHEKEYIVRINKPVTDAFIKGMSEGVPLRELKTKTRPCKVKKISKFTFSIILTQGLNRQIRRMCEFFDTRVVELKRVRIMNLELGDLKEGTYRTLTKEEQDTLNAHLSGSSEKPRYVTNGFNQKSRRPN